MTSPQTQTDSGIRSARNPKPAEILDRGGAYLDHGHSPKRSRWVARAPGHLDVMGGIAEYTGVLTLGTTLAGGVSVIVEPRDDRRIVIHTIGRSSNTGAEPSIIDLSIFDNGTGAACGSTVAARLPKSAGAGVRPVVGALYALRVSGKAGQDVCGLTIVVDEALLPSASDADSSSEAVATLLAVGRAWDLRLDPIECAHLAVRAVNDVVDVPCGISAAMGALHGKPGMLTQVTCHTNELLPPFSLPEGTAVLGIDSGARHAAAREKYVHARVATFMGRFLVDRIIASQNGQPIQWNGSLAQLSIGDYVNHLRDRIPTRISGSSFLERFGETGDALTRIDSQKVYKIRSRTEHHIYESARTQDFAERLAHAARTQNRRALVEAGELMYASHWSYGQRCGLGSIETDRLVRLLRDKGPDAGIFGARISGCGGGGRIVVLIADTQSARDTVLEAVQRYEQEMSLTAAIFDGGSPGALEFGVHEG